MNLFSFEDANQADKQLVHQGFLSSVLMENAGTAFVSAAREYMGTLINKTVLVCCGPGKNGADGLVIARKLIFEGARVMLVLASSPAKLGPEAFQEYQLFTSVAQDHFLEYELETLNLQKLESMQPDLVIDALFGIGLNRPLSSEYAALIQWMNQSTAVVGAVDIPSGLGIQRVETEQVIFADFTVMFGLMKIDYGLNGYTHFGKCFLSALSAPYDKFNSDVYVNSPTALPPRALNGNKGTFGQALFLGGSGTYYGAPYFNAKSFLLSGGGYARLGVPASLCSTIASLAPEIVLLPLPEADDHSIPPSAIETVANILSAQDVLAVGSGLSRSKSAGAFFKLLLNIINVVTIIDGDGLHFLGENLNFLINIRRNPLVLTPHVGEMARLTKLSIPDIKRNAVDVVRKYSAVWNAIIVLKDARTIIGSPEGGIWCNLSGNDGLATPGTGDVLVGMIAALACQAAPLVESVRNAVFLHGLAADMAAEDIGKDSLTATKLMEYIPLALKAFRKSPELYHNYRITVIP